VHSTMLIAHSDKEGTAATYKRTFRFHSILVTCDNTGELPAPDDHPPQRHRTRGGASVSSGVSTPMLRNQSKLMVSGQASGAAVDPFLSHRQDEPRGG
jgi:hypothetical protein